MKIKRQIATIVAIVLCISFLPAIKSEASGYKTMYLMTSAYGGAYTFTVSYKSNGLVKKTSVINYALGGGKWKYNKKNQVTSTGGYKLKYYRGRVAKANVASDGYRKVEYDKDGLVSAVKDMHNGQLMNVDYYKYNSKQQISAQANGGWDAFVRKFTYDKYGYCTSERIILEKGSRVYWKYKNKYKNGRPVTAPTYASPDGGKKFEKGFTSKFKYKKVKVKKSLVPAVKVQQYMMVEIARQREDLILPVFINAQNKMK